MNKKNTFTGELAEYIHSFSDAEWAYYDYLDGISDKLNVYIQQHGITKAEVARRLGKSPAYVTKLMRGDINMSFKAFTALLCAIGAKAVTAVVPENSEAQIYIPVQKHNVHPYITGPMGINITRPKSDTAEWPTLSPRRRAVKNEEYRTRHAA